MSKIIINKQILLNRIAELEKEQAPLKFGQELYYQELEHRIEELQSILQQGEESNETWDTIRSYFKQFHKINQDNERVFNWLKEHYKAPTKK